MRGEGMTQGVAGRILVEFDAQDSRLHRALQIVLLQMMPPPNGTRLSMCRVRESRRGKNILPQPFAGCRGILVFDCGRQGRIPAPRRPFALMLQPPLFEM